jgi:DNA gyrase subunit A
VVGLETVTNDDELLLLTEKGVMLRCECAKISVVGRSTQGVKVINLDDGDSVAAVTKVVQMESNAEGVEEHKAAVSLFDEDDEA